MIIGHVLYIQTLSRLIEDDYTSASKEGKILMLIVLLQPDKYQNGRIYIIKVAKLTNEVLGMDEQRYSC